MIEMLVYFSLVIINLAWLVILNRWDWSYFNVLAAGFIIGIAVGTWAVRRRLTIPTRSM